MAAIIMVLAVSADSWWVVTVAPCASTGCEAARLMMARLMMARLAMDATMVRRRNMGTSLLDSVRARALTG